MNRAAAVASCVLSLSVFPAGAIGQCPMWLGGAGAFFAGGSVPGVTAMLSFGPPGGTSLFVGGRFGSFTPAAGGAIVNAGHIAQWDGSAWSALGPAGAEGVSGEGWLTIVRDLTVFDPDRAGPEPAALIIAGRFLSAGGQAASHVARWDGTAFSSMGAGLPQEQFALAVLDDGISPPRLFAGGYGGVHRWMGSEWGDLGTPGGGGDGVSALLAFDADGAGPLAPELIAGGRFSGGIARWDGQSWSLLGGGLPGPALELVSALEVYDADGAGAQPPVLIIGGTFESVGGVAAKNIASWNGTAWSALGAGLGSNNHYVEAISSYTPPGASAPLLIAGGEFPLPMGSVANIASWDESTGAWTPMGRYLGSELFNATGIWSLAVHEEQPGGATLYAGGVIWSGGPGVTIARFGCQPCYANCDGSTIAPALNVDDFTCFIDRFAARDPYANCDGSSATPMLNVDDFSCFINAFAAGCR